MEWEIGLVESYVGPATKIIGPFFTAKEAANAAANRNIRERRGRLVSWMWARKGEIGRAQNCTETTSAV